MPRGARARRALGRCAQGRGRAEAAPRPGRRSGRRRLRPSGGLAAHRPGRGGAGALHALPRPARGPGLEPGRAPEQEGRPHRYARRRRGRRGPRPCLRAQQGRRREHARAEGEGRLGALAGHPGQGRPGRARRGDGGVRQDRAVRGRPRGPAVLASGGARRPPGPRPVAQGAGPPGDAVRPRHLAREHHALLHRYRGRAVGLAPGRRAGRPAAVRRARPGRRRPLRARRPRLHAARPAFGERPGRLRGLSDRTGVRGRLVDRVRPAAHRGRPGEPRHGRRRPGGGRHAVPVDRHTPADPAQGRTGAGAGGVAGSLSPYQGRAAPRGFRGQAKGPLPPRGPFLPPSGVTPGRWPHQGPGTSFRSRAPRRPHGPGTA
ncbi:putative tRNA nucleotidyltransferase, CC-adding [Streptomyces misionensis JCM 4497]